MSIHIIGSLYIFTLHPKLFERFFFVFSTKAMISTVGLGVPTRNIVKLMEVRHYTYRCILFRQFSSLPTRSHKYDMYKKIYVLCVSDVYIKFYKNWRRKQKKDFVPFTKGLLKTRLFAKYSFYRISTKLIECVLEQMRLTEASPIYRFTSLNSSIYLTYAPKT